MNRVNLLGRLTDDPMVKISNNGTTVTNFTLAVNRYNKEKEQFTDFVPCVAFNGTAETIGNYVLKGSQIAIEGRINVSSYEKDGKRHYSMKVIVEKFEFCGSKKAA